MRDAGDGSGLVTDLYELTMACGYWRHRMADVEATFTMTFRENPFAGGFTVACGLGPAIELLRGFRFDDDACAYLSTLRGNDDRPLFPEPYLDVLGAYRFTCDVDAVAEGTIVFPHEPLVRVTGPILQAQLVESVLLNVVNFQSLVATKAARVALAAKGDPVIEFGLRRAQGLDGALAASRAAWVGGCAATSNVLAGRTFGIPVAGTVAHSWVMAFDGEEEAFEAYASAMPNNVILLVDTYDTLEGVRRAVETGKRLARRGHRLAGIRLDSGDLAWLSVEARKILDAAGLADTRIAASNDFDEHVVASLKEQGARIDVWGVGTRLVTGWDQPALGGVYKLNAIRRPGRPWSPRIKLSEQVAKTSSPGLLRTTRFAADDGFVADMVSDEQHPPGDGEVTIVDPLDPTRRKVLDRSLAREELLLPVLRGGEPQAPAPSLEESRRRVQGELERFHSGIKRFVHPHRYPVGLEESLYRLGTDLVLGLRGGSPRPAATA